MRFLVLFCFISFSTGLFSQEFSNNRPVIIGGFSGISVVNLEEFEMGTTVLNLPTLGAFFEYRINRKVAFGFDLTYGYNTWEIKTYPSTQKKEINTYTRVRFVPQIKLYALDKKNETVRHTLFWSFGIGYRYARFSGSYSGVEGDIIDWAYEFPVATKVAFAYGIDLFDIWFTKIEVSYGGPFLSLGTGLRF